MFDISLSDDTNETNVTPQGQKNGVCQVLLEQMTSPVTNEQDDSDGLSHFQGTADVGSKRSYAEAVSPHNKRKPNTRTGETPPEKFTGNRFDH